MNRAFLLALVCLGAADLWAQPPSAAPTIRSAQQNAAAAMQESLAKQRESVQKQLGQSTASFFVLPRAASLGGVTGSVGAAVPMLSVPECDPLPAPELDSLVGETAEREGLSADLLRGVIRQESGFRPCAVSSKGAMGLMQLMPSTAEQFGIDDPFNPSSNLDAGARFLKQLLTKYGGDIPKALGAYNAGPAKVDAAGGVPAIPETVDYVKQILANLPFH